VTANPRRADLLVGAAGAAVTLVVVAIWGQGALVGSALAVIAGGALGASRRYPGLTCMLASALILIAALDGTFIGGGDEFVAYAIVAAHAFSCGRYDARFGGLGGPIALAVAAEAGAFREHESRGFFVFIVVAMWFAGRALREREQLAASLALRIEELDREQEAHAQLSIRYERARIAAELHDLVAHAISVMVIQAGAGQRLASRDAELTRGTFQAIAGAAREAEGDLGRLLTLLGDRDATALADLALVQELVARSEASGLDVRLRLEGDTEALPLGLVELAHRVVQEGITNALRYASGASIEVLVRGESESMLVEVANGPAREASSLAGTGTGNGLRGLRERADGCGGTIHAGPDTAGGWRLVARAPLPGLSA
jgi:signal transduction histidine kinase